MPVDNNNQSSFLETGIATAKELAAVIPDEKRLAKGPVVIVECFQRIPCNPCVDACKRGAITMSDDINDLPIVDFDLCNGCGVCISKCPGLAIFVVDKTYSETHSVLRLPYEFLPVPSVGQFVSGMDRTGKVRGSFEVVKVVSGGAKNMTTTVWLAVPHELAMEVRAIIIRN